jgi:hypothetical protein
VLQPRCSSKPRLVVVIITFLFLFCCRFFPLVWLARRIVVVRFETRVNVIVRVISRKAVSLDSFVGWKFGENNCW